MGSSSSKVAGKAAAAAGRRRYPSTASILDSSTPRANAPSSQATAPSNTVHQKPHDRLSAEPKSEHIDLDGRDPHFGSKLRALGPAMPVVDARPQDGAFPTSSKPPIGQQDGGQQIFPNQGRKSSGGTNPAIVIVNARERITKLWDNERDALGRGSFAGRTMLSAGELAEVIQLRDEGLAAGDIEKKLRLSRGLVERLGVRGVVANV